LGWRKGSPAEIAAERSYTLLTTPIKSRNRHLADSATAATTPQRTIFNTEVNSVDYF
jgi:hypothetical protein